MLQKLLQEAKGNRRDYVASLMKNVFGRSAAYGGAKIGLAPGNALKIKLTKSQTDLQRFKTLSYSSRYLYLKNEEAGGSVYPLDQMAEDNESSLLAESTSRSGNLCVRLRKGDKNEKDVFIEVWTSNSSQALRQTLKVTDKMSKIYNDVVFGGISWSDDESKLCFIGEIPEPAAFKNPWENKKAEEEKKEAASGEDEKKAEEKKEEEKKEEHF